MKEVEPSGVEGEQSTGKGANKYFRLFVQNFAGRKKTRSKACGFQQQRFSQRFGFVCHVNGLIFLGYVKRFESLIAH